MTSSPQAAKHQPSEEIKAILALAALAEKEVNDLGTKIHRLFGNITAAGEQDRNGAIICWRYACQQSAHVHDLAQQASGSEAAAQEYERRATEDIENPDPVRWMRYAEGYYSEARRLDAAAAAHYDVEVKIPIATAYGLLNEWSNAQG